MLAIGVDHGLDQINKDCKGNGGFNGVEDDELDKHFMIAPVKKIIVAQYHKQFNITPPKSSIHVHHQDNKRHVEFHNKSTSLYVACLKEFLNNPRLDFDCTFNSMTHSVLNDAEDLLNIDPIGDELMKEFIRTRKTGAAGSVWDLLPRRNLATFRNQAKVLKVPIKEKVVTLREVRGLINRLESSHLGKV